MDINNCLNKVFSFFDSLKKELSLGFCLVDTFSNCFSFLSVNWKDFDSINTYWKRLNNVFENSLINQNRVFITSDTSVKNNVATSISHIYRGQEIIAKSVHHTWMLHPLKPNSLLLDAVSIALFTCKMLNVL